MRTFTVKTNKEVNGFMARKNQIQGASYTASSPSEVERSKEANQLNNTNETVLAADAPELVVFLQESDYQSVKDIFINREVRSKTRLKYKDIYSKFHSNVVGDSEEQGKTLRTMSSISKEIEQGFQNYVRKQHALENLMKGGEEDATRRRDGSLLNKSTEKTIAGMQQVKKVQVEDAVSLNHMQLSATRPTDGNIHLIEASSNSEAESGSTIHRSDSSLTTLSSLEEFIEGPEYQHPHTKTKSLSRIGHGDRGSFAVVPLSGPISCSGSTSLRWSTSSNASSQSFAFPVLQSEWNGSPVRMVEAEQRQQRKHQSWRTCFLCSNF